MCACAVLLTVFSFIASLIRQGGEAALEVAFMMWEAYPVVLSIWEGGRAPCSYGLQIWVSLANVHVPPGEIS